MPKLIDAAVSRFDELDRESAVLVVRLGVSREWGGREVFEVREELHLAGVVSDEVLQQEELNVAAELTEQREELVANAAVLG